MVFHYSLARLPAHYDRYDPTPKGRLPRSRVPRNLLADAQIRPKVVFFGAATDSGIHPRADPASGSIVARHWRFYGENRGVAPIFGDVDSRYF